MAKKKEMPMMSSPTADPSWQAEDDARTMMRHGEIMGDPKRMAAAHKHLKKQKKAISSVEELKSLYAQKVKDSDADGA